MQHERKQLYAGEKKKVSVPVFSCRPQYCFSSYRKKKKKKKRSDAWSSSRDNVLLFFNSKSSVFSVYQRLQGDMVKKSRPAVAHFAEELQNSFSNPYVDSHGSSQIEIGRRQAILGHSHL